MPNTDNVRAELKHVSRTRTLLLSGAAAGPLYIMLGGLQMVTREGFDMRRHALSQLANGDMGWVQVVNFLSTGLLVILGAAGIRRTLRASCGGTWGPALLALYGIGLVGAGVFIADPAPGFPPGTPARQGISTSGVLHFVFGAISFYAVIGATFVFARRFRETRHPVLMLYSLFTGLSFLLVFTAVASGSASATTMLALYAVVAWTWIWHSILHVTVLHGQRSL